MIASANWRADFKKGDTYKQAEALIDAKMFKKEGSKKVVFDMLESAMKQVDKTRSSFINSMKAWEASTDAELQELDTNVALGKVLWAEGGYVKILRKSQSLGKRKEELRKEASLVATRKTAALNEAVLAEVNAVLAQKS